MPSVGGWGDGCGGWGGWDGTGGNGGAGREGEGVSVGVPVCVSPGGKGGAGREGDGVSASSPCGTRFLSGHTHNTHTDTTHTLRFASRYVV